MTQQTLTLTRLFLLAANTFLAGANFQSLILGVGSPLMNKVAVVGGIIGAMVGGNMILRQMLANGEQR